MSSSTDDQSRLHQRYSATNVCVTGAAGFVGGWLAETLLSLGARVVLLDDCSTGDPMLPPRLIDQHNGRCQFVEGSILDPQALADAFDNSSIVFHLAAQASAPASVEDPARTFAVNVEGTRRVAEAARAAGVTRLIVASSSAVYGDGEPPMRESGAILPLSPYAASKAADEAIVAAWANSMGLPGMSLRLFNVYGPRQRAGGAYAAVITAFASRALEGKAPVIDGDGSQTRDFVHVRDVVRAFLLAGAAELTPMGDIVNVGSGQATRIDDLASMLVELAKERGVAPMAGGVEHAPPRPGDPGQSVADTARCRALLGFEASISLREGLRETMEWLAGGVVKVA
ncbi:MAG: NAD-dependent epimerase/dehydratase family protein [Phycisphaeraceae bacterium]|nr:NAD-dependent epimerase/dehydratase family protein [Phycisphaeraceae bacterium]